jgi:hypothetical protein
LPRPCTGQETAATLDAAHYSFAAAQNVTDFLLDALFLGAATRYEV